MNGPSASQTSPTLLVRLRRTPTDEGAWQEFCRRYGGRILLWCRQWHLHEADAQDVTQTVLLTLAERMRHFDYDPAGSFRGWLRTVTLNAWRKLAASQRRAGAGSGDSVVDRLLQTVAARDDLVAKLEEEFDRELLDEALVRVQLSVTRERWEAFRLTALEGMSGAEAARKLSLKVATVYSMRSKVQKLVRTEMNKLEKLGMEPPTP